MQAQISKRFTVYFGVPSRENASLSPQLQALNLNMIRTAPSNLQSWGLPDANQVGYGTYKTHLPHFMAAHLL